MTGNGRLVGGVVKLSWYHGKQLIIAAATVSTIVSATVAETVVRTKRLQTSSHRAFAVWGFQFEYVMFDSYCSAARIPDFDKF